MENQRVAFRTERKQVRTLWRAYFRNRKAAELSNSCTSLSGGQDWGLELGVADSFFSSHALFVHSVR
jgi:hypothetical protein